MHQVKRFDSTVNTSGQSKIENLRLDFQTCFEFFIRWANRSISLNYWSDRKFMMFFTYYYQSKTSQEKKKSMGYQSLSKGLIRGKTKNTKWRQSKTMLSTLMRLQEANYQDFITQFLGKAIQKMRIPGNLPYLSYTFRR